MGDYKKLKNPLQIHKIENGIVLPQKERSKEPFDWEFGGVCDNNNCFCDASCYDGDWAKQGGYYDWKNEKYIDEKAVYIGYFFRHWGHLLVDLSGRYWCLSDICAKYPSIKVAYTGDEEPEGNYLRFFELLGVKKEQLIRIKEPTRFQTVLLPEQAFKPKEWYSDEFIRMFDKLYESVSSEPSRFSHLSNYKKVYFSRRSFKKAIYTEFGEEFFEGVFCDNGFVSVYPEKLSLDEQIYIWNNADEIACINGSLIINSVFSTKKDLKLTVLTKTSIPHENPYIFLQARGLSAEFINVYSEPFKNYPKSLGAGPFLLKKTKGFSDYCKSRQFTVKRKDRYFSNYKSYIVAVVAAKRRKKKKQHSSWPVKLIRKIRKKKLKINDGQAEIRRIKKITGKQL